MAPDELDRAAELVRQNLITAGMNPFMIKNEHLRATAMFVNEKKLGLRNFSLAVAYNAIAWTMEAIGEGKIT